MVVDALKSLSNSYNTAGGMLGPERRRNLANTILATRLRRKDDCILVLI